MFKLNVKIDWVRVKTNLLYTFVVSDCQSAVRDVILIGAASRINHTYVDLRGVGGGRWKQPHASFKKTIKTPPTHLIPGWPQVGWRAACPLSWCPRWSCVPAWWRGRWRPRGCSGGRSERPAPRRCQGPLYGSSFPWAAGHAESQWFCFPGWEGEDT